MLHQKGRMTMAHYEYLIVGGGMTGDAAAEGIREMDPEGTIGLIGAEQDPPYNRPPLTKGLWKDKPYDSIWRHTQGRGVDLHLGRRATTLDAQNKRVTDDQADTYTYEKLLLATGGRPRRLPFPDEGIIYFRTVEDYRCLRAMAEQPQRFAVIGGGFIGSEIAAALAMQERDVTMLFLESGIGGRLYPAELCEFLNDFYRQKGVEVLAGESITGMERQGEQFVLFRSGGRQLVVDGVVAGLGIEPDVELAQQAGLHLENGIMVDELCCTSRPDIYAAGDVAQFFNPALAKYVRIEHEDNALTMGRTAGRNMAGDARPYHHLPYFYSDLFELGYEAVGDLDARLETVVDWEEPFHKGVIYYLKQGRVRGVLLWNVWDQVEAARALIAALQKFEPRELMGRLPAPKVPVGAGQK
jgi:3-phenylpropionate/trans-cinnamate dioxygenase ferredoxin reductase component